MLRHTRAHQRTDLVTVLGLTNSLLLIFTVIAMAQPRFRVVRVHDPPDPCERL